MSPPGSKNPSTRLKTEIYQDVLPLLLAGMFSGRSGCPERLGGYEDPNAEDAKEGSQWEKYSGSESSDEVEGEDYKDIQELPA